MQFWSPHPKKDIVDLEKLQRMAIKIIKVGKHSYVRRDKIAWAFILERSWLRRDMTKILLNDDYELFTTSFTSRNSGHLIN